MKLKPITAKYHVTKTLRIEDLSELVNQGFAKVICNLPDGEVPECPPSEILKDAAKDFGIDFVYLPVTITEITPELVLQHTNEVINTHGGVAAYCATGRRSTVIWALEFSNKRSLDDIIAKSKAIGFDLSGMRMKLEEFSPLPSNVRL